MIFYACWGKAYLMLSACKYIWKKHWFSALGLLTQELEVLSFGKLMITSLQELLRQGRVPLLLGVHTTWDLLSSSLAPQSLLLSGYGGLVPTTLSLKALLERAAVATLFMVSNTSQKGHGRKACQLQHLILIILPPTPKLLWPKPCWQEGKIEE